MILAAIERRLGAYWAVATGRLRAMAWRWRGARLGQRTKVAARCIVLRPWTLVVGARAELEPDVYIKVTSDGARLTIGNDVFVGRGVEFDISCALTVGNDVLIAPGCFVTDHFHRHAAAATIASQGCEEKPVAIGDDVWLGANVVVLAGVTIGRGAIVGAGAVVNRDVEPMAVVAGVPARRVGSRK